MYYVSQLYEPMVSLASSITEVYSSNQYLKKKLEEKYSKTVLFILLQ